VNVKFCFVFNISVAAVVSDACLIDVLQGYQGMVDGGDHLVLAEWKTVSNIIQRVWIFFAIYF